MTVECGLAGGTFRVRDVIVRVKLVGLLVTSPQPSIFETPGWKVAEVVVFVGRHVGWVSAVMAL